MHDFSDGWSFWKVEMDVITDESNSNMNSSTGGDNSSTDSNMTLDSNTTATVGNTNTTENSTTNETVTVNGTTLQNSNTSYGIFLKKVSNVAHTQVLAENITAENYTVVEKHLLLWNASNPKIWFIGN